MHDATLTVGAWRRCPLWRRSYRLRGLNELMTTLLTFVPLLSPGMSILDGMGVGTLWALHKLSAKS
jgi:hypothetical protein